MGDSTTYICSVANATESGVSAEEWLRPQLGVQFVARGGAVAASFTARGDAVRVLAHSSALFPTRIRWRSTACGQV